MINSKLIYKILGQLLFIEAFLLFVSLLVAYYYQQEDVFAFVISTLATIGGGLILKWRGHGADNSMSRRDAYLVVSLSWIIFSLFGTLPFMISGYISNFTDAYFETMSGFTTTGATILDDVECFPHGLLFWRSLTQWIGGLGIVFFTIALLPSLVGGQTKVFAAEATGPIKTKLHPRLSTSAKWIWSIYLVLTIACIASYYVAGMNLFDSFNYAMTTTATGGFSTHNSSTSFFHSPALEYICTFFCFLSGVNFTLLYAAVIKFKIKDLFKNSEFKFYVFLVSAFTAFACLTSLGSWMMLVGQAGVRAANDGNFPKVYGEVDSNGIPKKGLLLAAVKMTALMILITLMNSAGGKASDLFGELTGIAVLLTMLPYFYSCVDLIRFEGVNIRNFVSLICSVLGCVFCFIALMGASSFERAGTFIVSLTVVRVNNLEVQTFKRAMKFTDGFFFEVNPHVIHDCNNVHSHISR